MSYMTRMGVSSSIVTEVMSGAEGGAEVAATGYSMEASTKIAVRAQGHHRDAKYKHSQARLPDLADANNGFAGCLGCGQPIERGVERYV